jgi:molecular chaperone HscB
MNYFDLFDLPVSYSINEKALTDAYLRKQSAVHPDVDESTSDDSAYLNAAYIILLNPLDRAKYFLETQGRHLDALDFGFESEAFDLQEQYESLSTADDKEIFKEELSKKICELISKLYCLENDLDEFQKNYNFLRFLNSFREKITK